MRSLPLAATPRRAPRLPPLYLALVVVASGCAAVGDFSRSMEGRREPLRYEPGDAVAGVKEATTLGIGKVSFVGPLPAATTVKVVDRMVLPLLVINYFDETWRCELGRAQLANDPERFLESSLGEEIQRGSRHTLVAGPADRTLDVTVTRIEALAPIRHWLAMVFLLGAGSMEDSLRAGPVVSSIEAEVALRTGQEAPRLLKVLGRAEVEVPNGERGEPELDLVLPALVRGLSEAIHDLNRKIVEAIDAPAGSSSAGVPAST